MLHHVLVYQCTIVEETSVTQLIYLIITDGLNGHAGQNVLLVILRCNNTSDTTTSIRNLRSRYKLEYEIRITGFFTEIKDVEQVPSLLILCIEVMYAVSVIPEHTEILSCRL